jgi:hypothetical protein
MPVRALIVVAAVAAACAAPAPTPAIARPAVGANRDARFELRVQSERSTFRSNDAIEPVAFVTYLGPADTVVFHAASMVGFRIQEIGGPRSMGGGMDLPCLQTPMASGQTLPFPFEKAGAVAENPAEGFDAAWYQDPTLRLPPGRWQIIAYLDASLGDCGGEPHQFEANIELVVEP